MRRFAGRLPLVMVIVGTAAPARLHAQAKGSGPILVVAGSEDALDELRRKQLLFPVAGQGPSGLKDTFNDERGQGRVHHALDILAARGTPVISPDDGRVLKLHR